MTQHLVIKFQQKVLLNVFSDNQDKSMLPELMAAPSDTGWL